MAADVNLKGPVYQGQAVGPVHVTGPIATPPHLEYGGPILVTPPRSATPPYLTPPVGAIHPPDLATPTWTAWMHVGEAVAGGVPTFAHRTSFPTPGLPALQTTDIGTAIERLQSTVGATANQATPTARPAIADRISDRLTALAARWAGRAPRAYPLPVPTGYLARIPNLPITDPLAIAGGGTSRLLDGIHPPISAR